MRIELGILYNIFKAFRSGVTEGALVTLVSEVFIGNLNQESMRQLINNKTGWISSNKGKNPLDIAYYLTEQDS